jgi:uncharacterized protein (TIGR02452 family)
MRKSKEELIEIWKDTESKFSNYHNNIKGYKTKSIEHPFTGGRKKCNVTVENQDCIEVARRLSETGRTCMLNMASYKHPGGGVTRGAMAQEEELSRRSNLMLGLTEFDYPLSMDDVLYNTDVTFFKDGNYNVIESFSCDIITIAAVNLNGLEKPKNYADIMWDKAESMFYEAHKNGCKNLVLSAFGCGVFKNDPYDVAYMFKDIMDAGGAGLFDNVVFAIINDRNSVASNFEIFNEVLTETEE